MTAQVIFLQETAPAKPPLGAACNGCGVCCLSEPCPVGMLLSLRRSGACARLRWDGQRYRCGVLDGASPWRRGLVARWIGTGRGCDSSAQVQQAADAIGR